MSNILSEVHPELVAEWSDKNLPLTPYKITCSIRYSKRNWNGRNLTAGCGKTR